MRDLAQEADQSVADFQDGVPVLAMVRELSPPCPEPMTMAPSEPEQVSPVVAATNQVQLHAHHRPPAIPAHPTHSIREDICYYHRHFGAFA